jgi:hypothetical protein
VHRFKVQRREKDSRYIQKASAPVTMALYQICNVSPAHVHICNRFLMLHITQGTLQRTTSASIASSRPEKPSEND